VKILLDTNILLEILLQQEKAAEAQELLSHHQQFITDYTIHSIGTLLFYRKQFLIFESFVQDLVYRIRSNIVSIPSYNLHKLRDPAEWFNIDFDDAYQYLVAESYNLTIVSFDKDFDQTKRGRKTPDTIIDILHK